MLCLSCGGEGVHILGILCFFWVGFLIGALTGYIASYSDFITEALKLSALSAAMLICPRGVREGDPQN